MEEKRDRVLNELKHQKSLINNSCCKEHLNMQMHKKTTYRDKCIKLVFRVQLHASFSSKHL